MCFGGCHYVQVWGGGSIGGSRGGREGRTPPPGRPNSFDFMQFSGKFGVFTPPLEGSRPPLGKILDPPLGRYPEMNKFERVSGDDHQVSVAGGGYSEMNKFKQVSSDDHQISVVGKGRGMGITHDMSRWLGVSYHVTYPMMHLMLPTIYSGQNDRRL